MVYAVPCKILSRLIDKKNLLAKKFGCRPIFATKEVGHAINEIRAGASENIAVDDGAVVADTQANQSGDGLKRIVQLAIETSQAVRSIATAAEQQIAVSEEINRAVDEISRVTVETSSGMNQPAQAVTELAELAEKLRSRIRLITENS